MRQAARFCVHVRRAQRAGGGRALRRAQRLAQRTLVWGVAPAVASDSLFAGHLVDGATMSHDAVSSVLATMAATLVHDVLVLARARMM